MTMVDWSTLPSDLLITITRLLESMEDLIYFSVVCHSWNDIFTIIKRELNNSATPWLLLADPNPNHDKHKLEACSCPSKIFEINKIKGLDLKIPLSYRRQCFGSKYGWIVMIGFDDWKVLVYNPINKTHLNLPNLSSLPQIQNHEIIQNGTLNFWVPIQFTIQKAIVLKIDENDDDFVVMLIYNQHLQSNNNQLVLSRPGTRRWTKVITSREEVPPDVIDAVYWNGLVLILHNNGLITSCELSALVNFSSWWSSVYANKPYHSILFPSFIEVKLDYYQACYMVELAGDLLLVLRYKDMDYTARFCYYTCDFKVYKLDGSGNEKCWTVVDDLGDYMVFVGNNSAMSVHKSKLPNSQHNAIYFTDDIVWKDLEQSRHDIGMYDMSSRICKLFYKVNNKRCSASKPLWFMPKF